MTRKESVNLGYLGYSFQIRLVKQLIEDICKNSQLLTKFDKNGYFSFYNIFNLYDSTDKIEIKSNDVISLDLSATPISNIYTAVNVKFKKDYARDEYTKQTGYCDGYDFFGNGDGYISGNIDVGGIIYDFDELGGLTYELNGETITGYKYSNNALTREDNVYEVESDYIRDYDVA